MASTSSCPSSPPSTPAHAPFFSKYGGENHRFAAPPTTRFAAPTSTLTVALEIRISLAAVSSPWRRPSIAPALLTRSCSPLLSQATSAICSGRKPPAICGRWPPRRSPAASSAVPTPTPAAPVGHPSELLPRTSCHSSATPLATARATRQYCESHCLDKTAKAGPRPGAKQGPVPTAQRARAAEGSGTEEKPKAPKRSACDMIFVRHLLSVARRPHLVLA